MLRPITTPTPVSDWERQHYYHGIAGVKKEHLNGWRTFMTACSTLYGGPSSKPLRVPSRSFRAKRKRTITGVSGVSVFQKRTMWKWLAVLVVLGIAADAAAQPRPNTLQMSCRQAQALVVSHGAIVLGTGPNRYERYVRDQSFCPVGMRTETIWDQTADLAACPVGYRCRDASEIGTRSGDP